MYRTVSVPQIILFTTCLLTIGSKYKGYKLFIEVKTETQIFVV